MVTKPRSPNYPSIDLRTAVERVKPLYQKVQRGGFTTLDAAQAWGYSGPTDRVRRTMGALRQYGLVEAKRGEDARLTVTALTLALREPESKEFQSALRDAVEAPDLFQELIESGRENDAVGALRHYLVVEKRFTKEGATIFTEVFKGSVAFAGIDKDDNMLGLEDGVIDGSEEPMTITTPASSSPPSSPPPSPGSMAIPIPLSSGGMGTVTLPVGMTAVDWERLDAILSAYRTWPNSQDSSSASGASEQADD